MMLHTEYTLKCESVSMCVSAGCSVGEILSLIQSTICSIDPEGQMRFLKRRLTSVFVSFLQYNVAIGDTISSYMHVSSIIFHECLQSDPNRLNCSFLSPGQSQPNVRINSNSLNSSDYFTF